MLPVKNPPTKAILFDLFNTLTSVFVPGVNEEHACDILGIARSDWEKALFDNPGRRLKGEITGPEAVIRDITDKIDPALPDELIRRTAAMRIERFKNVVQAVPDHIIDVLRELKNRGMLLALVSNADVTEHTGWPGSPAAPLFDTTVFSCDAGFMKPETEIYRQALRSLDVQPEECLFVGDGGSDEFTGARACGIKTACTTEFIAGRWPERVTARCAQADYRISSLSALL